MVTVNLNQPPYITTTDTSFFTCDLGIEHTYDLSYYDPEGDPSVYELLSPFGSIDSQSGLLTYSPDTAGTYCFEVKITDDCNASTTDTVCITITTGDVAKIDCPIDVIHHSLCDPGEICIPIAVTPATAEVSVSSGVYENGELCFYADSPGTYDFTIIASEVCGSDTCDVTVVVTFDEYAEITCPDLPISAEICGEGLVSVLLPIKPTSASLVIVPFGTYDFNTNMLTFYADSAGQYEISVRAETPCNYDSCLLTINVAIDEPPEVIADDLDTTVCFHEVDEVCFGIDVIGSGVEITVEPIGTYSGGMVCVPITPKAVIHELLIIGTNCCGSDTATVTLTINENLPPELTLPDDSVLMIPYCEDDVDEVCINGIFAVDPEGDPLALAQICGPGVFTTTGEGNSGYVCFTPEGTNMTYDFCISATDGCGITIDTFTVTLYPAPSCSVCVELSIETDSCVVVGSRVPVYINALTNDEIGGFDLLIAYDASVMYTIEIFQGDAIPDWEYFTYRLGNSGDCSGNCPSGLLRIVSIADINDGANHPPQEQLTPQGTLAIISMQVVNDQNLGGLFLPINFFWGDCGDNAFAEPTGTELYIDAKIYDPFGVLIWDEGDDINFPDENRIQGLGAVDSCLEGDKISPIRCVNFYNGGISISTMAVFASSILIQLMLAAI
jgi:hypothetical protein